MPRPAAMRRSAPFSLLLAGTLLAWPAAATPTVATDLEGMQPPIWPVRGGGVKGDGDLPPAEPTGRVIVRYQPGTSGATQQTVLAAAGLDLVEDVALPDTQLVEPAGGLLTQAVTTLDAQPSVLYAEPEYRIHSQGGPVTDPLFGEQWALHNTGQQINGYVGVHDVDMNVREAWDVTTGDAGVVVAVLDNGVDFSHPDLAGQQWINPGETASDGIDNDGNGLIDDVNGWDFCNGDNTVHEGTSWHGTHVAGSIAASGNGAGIAGVAPSVRIMAVKILDDDNEACGATTATAIAAIDYAYSMGARIMNASWGQLLFSQALYDAVAQADDALIVAAAGNNNHDNDRGPTIYPASFDLPNILSVAAIHNEGHFTASTNIGRISVDLSAPGEAILSTIPGGTWAYSDGTSMAAANASGVAALAASARPALLGDGPALRDHLINTARALPSTHGWIANPRLLDARVAVLARPDIRRLAGSDRFMTAAAISQATFLPHVPYLFIAYGHNFPDALAGGVVAAQVGSPILLVNQGSIPAATMAEINRLKPYHIVVLGSAGVISDGVVNQLAAKDDPASRGPFRLAGSDRFATAAAISNAFFNSGVRTAIITTGLNFPDALAAVPASPAFGWAPAPLQTGPLLLVRPNSIPASTIAELGRLQPQQIIVLGSEGVVSAAVAAELDPYTVGPITRIAGPDRFATAAALADAAFPVAGSAFVATGLGFPDALAGGPAASAYGGPMLLVNSSTAPAATRQQLQRLQPARIFILGGPSVVSEGVVNQINALFP